MEDEEYKKLPAEEKCVHKLWKARVCGFEEVTQLFRQIDDAKSPEFEKYLGLVKEFVTDSNAMAQEKGLEATLAYVENYADAGKTVSEVMSGIVTKCVAAPGTKTRELALKITLMYIEIEEYEAVQEELMKGTEQKNPKIVSACIQALTTALHEFGVKIINPKPIIKKIWALFSDRDKGFRDEARLLVIEMYKWMGPSLKNHLQAAYLELVQMTELEAEFAKVEGQKAVPTRYIRSQQQKQAKLAASAEETNEGGDEGDEDEAPQEIDPYDLADPVDILSKLKKGKQNVVSATREATDGTDLTLIEKPFRCEICGAAFKRKGHLERHTLTHKPDRPFVCPECKKDYKQKESLVRHMRTHEPEKTHVCKECGKQFHRKDHLREHETNHITRRAKQTTATGVKPKSKQAKSPIKLSLSRKTVSPTKKPQNKPIITLPTVRIESPIKYYSPPQNLQKPQIIQNVSTENNCFPKEKQSYKGTPNIYSNTTPRQFLPAVCSTNSKPPSMNNSNDVLRTELFLQTNQSFQANESNETYTKINLSSSTYTKGNSSFETCIVGNMGARTYVKDSSIGDSENLEKSPISSLQREHSSPL